MVQGAPEGKPATDGISQVPAPRRAGPIARWRFSRLFDAPHRLAFAAATLMLVCSSVWWAVANVAFSDGIALRFGLPPAVAHSVWMTFGFMPLFFAGFMFTAGPKWLRQPDVDARTILPALLPEVAGWLVFMLAIHARDEVFGRTLGAIGLGAVVIGWSGIAVRFWRMVWRSTVEDRAHGQLIGVAWAVGIVALAVATVGVALGDHALVRAAVQAGLWGFNGLVFVAASHRMVPFLSGAAFPALDARRPQWLLWSLAGVFTFEAFAQAAEALGGVTAGDWNLLRAGVELPAGLAVLALCVRWALVQNLKLRLLAMLHIGFMWLGVSLLLSGFAHAAAAFGVGGSVPALAPVHAYAMGYLGTTMFTMVTRISCGHGGRTLAADDFVWRLFWVLQFVVIARIGAALASRVSFAWAMTLVVAAALGWAAVFLVWSVRHGYWYGTPRPDGRPG